MLDGSFTKYTVLTSAATAPLQPGLRHRRPYTLIIRVLFRQRIITDSPTFIITSDDLSNLSLELDFDAG